MQTRCISLKAEFLEFAEKEIKTFAHFVPRFCLLSQNEDMSQAYYVLIQKTVLASLLIFAHHYVSPPR